MAIQSDHEFAPTQIARAVFPTAFRGYDQDAVRRYLSRLAAALEHQQEYAGLGELEARTPAHERVEELEQEIDSLQDEIKALELELVQRSVDGADMPEPVAEPQAVVAESPAFDEHRAIELLGKETARVLESARSAASDILKRAETQAASLKAQAKSELAEARKRADALLSQKQIETEEMTIRMVSDAEASAERVTAEADEHRVAVLEESSKILTEAEELSAAEQAEAEERAKQIVADAETLRQQVIAELVVERRDAQTELDRVAGARDRLAMSLAVARSELDEVADALVDSLPPAGPSAKGNDPAAKAGTTTSKDAEAIAVDARTEDGPETDAELDLDAEVDGLIESLDAEPEAQELDLGIPDSPVNKPASKKKRQRGGKRRNGAGGQAKQNGAGSQPATKNSPSAKAGAASVETSDAAVAVQAKTESDESRQVEPAQIETEEAAEAEETAGNAAQVEDTATEVEDTATEVEDTATEVADTAEVVDTEPAESDSSTEVVDEVDSVDDVHIININAAPEEGGALSLVEGFTTLDVADSERENGAPADGEVDIDLTADDSANGAGTRTGDDHFIDLSSSDSDSVSEARSADDETQPDGDGDSLLFSVLVNEPQSPDEVITTVASRTATAQRDRTRGDLLIDEAFTGRLPKQFAARDVALTRSGPAFRRQLRRALNDDQSDVLDRLRAGRGVIKVEELPTFGDQIDRYLAPLRRGLAEIAQAGARSGGQSDLSQSALDNLVRQLAKYIVDKVRVPTIQVVEETSDNDRERILEPVRALYRDFRNVGLPDLTEDALYEAFAIGLYDSIEPAAPIRWIVDPRSDPDPVCEINRERDDVAKGEVFPSGHARPLSLPGCRCLVTVAKY